MPVRKRLNRNFQPEPGHPTIALVVDDDAGVRGFIRRVLENHGHSVLEAADGVEGVAVFRQEHERIHIVVMDIEMPRMNGIDAFHEMKAIRTDVPVIIVSGRTADEFRDRLPITALAGVLQKPFMPDDLLAAVSRFEPRDETTMDLKV